MTTAELTPNSFRNQPDDRGHFGQFGGRYVAETLMPLVLDLEREYRAAKQDPAFAAQVKKGDVLVGAMNFGYGHPHYPPMIGMRHLGISAVLAESFSPGYWRGEVAMGFPQIACPGILNFVNRWDEIEVDWAAHQVINHTRKDRIDFEVWSEGDRLMIESGGVLGYLKHIRQEEST